MSEISAVAQRLEAIEQRIRAACARSGRTPSEVTLVGVSKVQKVPRLLEAFDAGLRIFGENRLQEAEEKARAMPAETEWHLIGPLQSNKIKRAAALFSAIHSVDRLKIARRLDSECSRREKRLDCFVEVNLGEEANKHGFLPSELGSAAEELAGLEYLRFVGLMAIPPRVTATSANPEAEARGWFRRLAALRDEWAKRPGWEAFPGYLSMGMSADFDIAVEEGATHVRVGTALFGSRASISEAEP